MGNQGAVFRTSLIRKDIQITSQVNKPMHYTANFTYVRYMYVFAQNNLLNEPPRKKTGFSHMQKQRRRSGLRLCFRYTDSTIPLLP